MLSLLLCLLFLNPLSGSSQTPPNQSPYADLQKLADHFWNWRAKFGPFTDDDVNRMERPGGTRDWSRTAVAARHTDLEKFESEWKAINPAGGPSRSRSITV